VILRGWHRWQKQEFEDVFGDGLKYDTPYVVGMVNAEPGTNGVHHDDSHTMVEEEAYDFRGAITGFEDAIDSVKANKMDRPLGIPRLLISMSSGACMLWIPRMISYWELPQPRSATHADR
jgi:hypothetical protein